MFVRLGHTKVFFRAGAMGIVEEVREESIKAILFHIQAMCRRWVHHEGYRKLCFKKEMIPVMQRYIERQCTMILLTLLHFRNMKKYLFFRDWTWYFLLNGTKRFIGQVDMDGVIKQLEEEAAEACGAYDAVVEIRDRLNEEINEMISSKKSMMAEIEESQGDLSSYQRDLATAADLKSQKEQELGATQKKLEDTEAERQGMQDSKRSLEGDIGSFRKDIEEVEMAVQKAEQEKTNKDHIIRGLNDEIAHQDELINKLNKEKKHAQETQAKASDEMTQAENKVDDLNKIKTKLEVTLDELEDSYDREKKARLEMDKQRRKTESELTVAQEEVADLEREKKEVEMAINKKDQEIAASQRKLEDGCSITGKLQKTLKEMQSKVELAEEVRNTNANLFFTQTCLFSAPRSWRRRGRRGARRRSSEELSPGSSTTLETGLRWNIHSRVSHKKKNLLL